jgi:RNA-binding protein 39
VRIIFDRGTRRSKGCAYVEFRNRASVATALALAGTPLLGRAVSVKASEAEKNLAWEAAQKNNPVLAAAAASLTGGDPAAAAAAASAAAAVGPLPPPPPPELPLSGPARLYVGGLHASITSDDVRDIFDSFGAVVSSSLAADERGRSSGFGWVVFADPASAARAMAAMDGVEVAGTALQVKAAPGQGSGRGGGVPPPPASLPPPPPLPAAPASELTSLASEETGGGLRMTADTRAALMARLGGGAAAAVAPPPPPPASTVALGAVAASLALEQGVLGPASPVATRCLLLKNMFDPAAEADPAWPDDIRADVGDECARFGAVDHVHVDPASRGYVYVRLAGAAAAAAAKAALHGRWFAGRQVVAEFQFAPLYASHFGLAP